MRDIKLPAVAMMALSIAMFGHPAAAQPPCPPASDNVAVGVTPPPPLPQYDQPPMPGYGYMWNPGYWGWNPGINDYYWIPGVWALPPAIGLLWTPPFWGWNDGVYLFHGGYWGPQVGFYGGINYGFGYGGFGYNGGYWQGRSFYYNRAANNFGGLHVNSVYNHPVSINRAAGRVSYNGGAGGVRATATPEQLAAARGAHVRPTAAQTAHAHAAALDRTLRSSANHGHPAAAGAASHGAAAGATHTPATTHGVHAAAAGAHGHGASHQTSRSGRPAAGAERSEFHPNVVRGTGERPSGGGAREARGGGDYRGGAPMEGRHFTAPSGGGRPPVGGGRPPSGGGRPAAAPGGGEHRPH